MKFIFLFLFSFLISTDLGFTLSHNQSVMKEHAQLRSSPPPNYASQISTCLNSYNYTTYSKCRAQYDKAYCDNKLNIIWSMCIPTN